MTQNIFTTLDAIRLISFKKPKSANIKPLNLYHDHQKRLKLHYKDGNPVLISYQKFERDKFYYISPEEFNYLDKRDQHLYKPIFEKEFQITSSSKLIFNKNIIKLIIFNLKSCNPELHINHLIYNNFKELEYYKILNQLESNDKYSNYWNIYNIEFDIYFNEFIGKLIIDNLRKKFKSKFSTTIYLSEKDNPIHLKFYNKSAQVNNCQINKATDCYKLEITISKSKIVKNIDKYTDFYSILQLYKDLIIDSFKDNFYNYLIDTTKTMIRSCLNVKNDNQLFNKLVSKELIYKK